MDETKQITRIGTRKDLENIVPGEAVDIMIESARWFGESVYARKKQTKSPRMVFIQQFEKTNIIGEVVIDPNKGHEENGYYVLTDHKHVGTVTVSERDYQAYFQMLKQAGIWREY